MKKLPTYSYNNIAQGSLSFNAKQVLKCLAIVLILFTSITNVYSALSAPAFPGAEGYGSKTSGGRGGKVFIVRNLNSTGNGSLREALEYEGPRIVLFNVGGVIDLGNKDIVIKYPYLTIAGQTSPGSGIAVKNAGIVISTHDVIIRGMRFRIGGDKAGVNPRYRDGVRISSEECTDQPIGCAEQPYNIILDHNSISWAVDENASTWSGVHDITFSWNIFSEGLSCSIHTNGCHSMGLLLGPESHNISIHHNIFAHNGERNPLIYNGNSVEFINNVIYNWTVAGTIAGGCAYNPLQGSKLNIIGNYYAPGPATYNYTADSHTVNRSILISTCWNDARIHMSDNLGRRLEYENEVFDWSLAKNETLNTIKTDTFALDPSGISTLPVLTSYELVLEKAGAISPKLDDADTRVIRNIRERTGNLLDSEATVGGWSEYQPSVNNNPDSDGDGLPDQWESQYKLDANNSEDASQTIEGSHYTNIENYINFRMINNTPLNVSALPSNDSAYDGVSTGAGGSLSWLLLISCISLLKRMA